MRERRRAPSCPTRRVPRMSSRRRVGEPKYRLIAPVPPPSASPSSPFVFAPFHRSRGRDFESASLGASRERAVPESARRLVDATLFRADDPGNVRDADRDARVVCGDVAGSVLTSVVAPAFLAPRVQTAPSPDPRMKPRPADPRKHRESLRRSEVHLRRRAASSTPARRHEFREQDHASRARRRGGERERESRSRPPRPTHARAPRSHPDDPPIAPKSTTPDPALPRCRSTSCPRDSRRSTSRRASSTA